MNPEQFLKENKVHSEKSEEELSKSEGYLFTSEIHKAMKDYAKIRGIELLRFIKDNKITYFKGQLDNGLWSNSNTFDEPCGDNELYEHFLNSKIS